MEIPKELLDIDPFLQPRFIDLYDEFAVVLYEEKFVVTLPYIKTEKGQLKTAHLFQPVYFRRN
jgi:hypothetical protein